MNKKPPAPANGKKANKAFWATILFLAFATLVLIIVAYIRQPVNPVSSANEEISVNKEEEATVPTCQLEELATQTDELKTELERLIGKAAEEAYYKVSSGIDDAVGKVYKPVYDAIPEYAKFHYSIIGEYIELFAAATGGVQEDIQERFFNGFDEQLEREIENINVIYNQARNSHFDDSLKNALKDKFDCIKANTEQLINTAKNKIKKSNLNIASLAGGSKVASVSAVLAGKITAKFAAKLTAKGLIKGASTLGGAGAGAGIGGLICAWAGPFAVGCAAVGAVAGWFLIDGIVVNISEIWGSEEFEADLKAIIDEHKRATSAQIKEALQDIATENGASKEFFTLQNHSTSK